MTGVKRNVEPKAKKLLEMFPIVAIVGARQVGKTTLAKKIAEGWRYVDLQNPNDSDRIRHDPLFFFQQNPEKVIIDEAQLFPELFPILRGIVDSRRQEKGRFIITGSSSFELLSNISESLAGRVGLIELGTLKANELYELPLSPFYESLSRGELFFSALKGGAPIPRQKIQRVWLKGGYPEPLLSADEDYYNQWMENYRETYINRDIAQLFPKLNKFAYRRFLTTLSKLSGTILNRSDLARSIEVSEGAVREYLSIAEGTFLWRSIPSYEKNIIKSVVKMPKGYVRDTGLFHYLAKISGDDDLYADPRVGSSFEGFVIEEIIKGLQSTMITNWSPYYYRTKNGAEIDLILDGPFGILPIEIKYGTTVRVRQLTALAQFIEEHNLPLGLVINQSETIEKLTPKIIQIPVGWV